MKHLPERPRPFPPRLAFTLIELLVVIAIIAVLAALVFPAYRTVVARANASKCAANLRQIGTAVAAYSAEHDGTFPRGGWGDGGALPLDPPGTDGVGWPTDIYPYLGRDREVFVCPEGKMTSPTGEQSWMRMPGASWSEPRYPMHYAYNAQLNTNRASFRTRENPPFNVDRAVSVQRLSGLPVMIDIVFQNNFYGGISTVFNPDPPDTSGQAFAARHGEKGNVLWGDGRVTAMTASEWASAPDERLPANDGWKRYNFCLGNY